MTNLDPSTDEDFLEHIKTLTDEDITRYIQLLSDEQVIRATLASIPLNIQTLVQKYAQVGGDISHLTLDLPPVPVGADPDPTSGPVLPPAPEEDLTPEP